MTPWWNDQTAGLIGGIGGSVIGLLGGVFGTLAGVCAPRGKCKGLVYGLASFLFAAGLVALAAGLVALSQRQPYAVWYPLVLAGGLLTVLFGFMFIPLRIRYRQADLRRLQAEEFRRS